MPRDAFEWLLQFAGQSMKVMESMGNFTVRTMDNKVVLSSATSPSAVFYCPAGTLEPHVGHEVVCAAYGEEGNPVNVSVECIECNETLFSMDAPAGQKGGEEEDPYPYQEPDGEDESA